MIFCNVQIQVVVGRKVLMALGATMDVVLLIMYFICFITGKRQPVRMRRKVTLHDGVPGYRIFFIISNMCDFCWVVQFWCPMRFVTTALLWYRSHSGD